MTKPRTNSLGERILQKDVWKHNSFLGHVRLAQNNMMAIIASKTATPRAKTQAASIYEQLKLLKDMLGIRTDQQ